MTGYIRVPSRPDFFKGGLARDAETTFSQAGDGKRVSAHKSESDVIRCGAKTATPTTGCCPPRAPSIGCSNQRRLSQGDPPYWLRGEGGGASAEEQKAALEDDEGFLLGRVLTPSGSHRKIRVTEVAPSNTSLRGEEPLAWRMPVEVFTSKKETDVKRHKNKRVRSYYKAQAELISAFEDISMKNQVDVLGDLDDPEAAPKIIISSGKPNYQLVLMLSKVTLLVNLLLLVAKAVASALSGSISIISALVDSALDLLSGVIMWWATRQVKKRDHYMYPQGRTKLEPVAVIILSVVMALASLQLLKESVEKIIGLAAVDTSLPVVDAVTFAIAGSTVVTKLVLWLVCRRVDSPTIQALAQDHRNDVLSNSVAIVCGYLGSVNFQSVVESEPGPTYGFSYADPGGAILISVYIMYNWWLTGSEQIQHLTGLTARPGFLSQLTWACVNHHRKVRHIDTVRAFHFGQNYLVEVDIVLPIDMALREAHDIGESLQHKLESLDEVERAFVHLDYEYSHKPNSEHKVV